MKYIDPTRMWVEDENGNLIAEDGDSNNTLAEYLNTTSDIALKMMIEQLWLFNPTENDEMTPRALDKRKESGNATLGSTFFVGGSTEGIDIKKNLGYMGNNIRDYAGSDFSKALYTNYATGGGDINLSERTFADILMFLKENNITPPSEAGPQVVNFYSSPEYDKAFGRATIQYNNKG